MPRSPSRRSTFVRPGRGAGRRGRYGRSPTRPVPSGAALLGRRSGELPGLLRDAHGIAAGRLAPDLVRDSMPVLSNLDAHPAAPGAVLPPLHRPGRPGPQGDGGDRLPAIRLLDRQHVPLPSIPSRVLVVDDHRAFAEMLAIALQAGGMDVVGTAHSAAQAVSLA
jgi:hypothetical protein